MKARVTITLDPDVHAQAKRTARMRRTTVSGMIEVFLRSPQVSDNDRSLVDEMLGSGKLRVSKRGQDPLYDELHKRHIARRR